MNKEKFIKIMESIQEHSKTQEIFGNSLKLISDSFPIITFGDKLISELIEILEDELKDIDNYIEWWLYEDVEKVVYVNKKEIDVRTLDKLYDFLKENKNG